MLRWIAKTLIVLTITFLNGSSVLADEVAPIFLGQNGYKLEIKKYEYALLGAPQLKSIRTSINDYEKAKASELLKFLENERDELVRDASSEIQNSLEAKGELDTKLKEARDTKERLEQNIEKQREDLSTLLLSSQKQISELKQNEKKIREQLSTLETSAKNEKKLSAQSLENQKSELLENKSAFNKKLVNLSQDIASLRAQGKKRADLDENRLNAEKAKILEMQSTSSKLSAELQELSDDLAKEKLKELTDKFYKTNLEKVLLGQYILRPHYDGSDYYEFKSVIINNSQWDIKNVSLAVMYKTEEGMASGCKATLVGLTSCDEVTFKIGDLKGKGYNKYDEPFDCVRTSTDAVIEEYFLITKPKSLRAFEKHTGSLEFDPKNVVLGVKSIEFGHPTLDGDRDCESIDFNDYFKPDILRYLQSSKKISDKQAEVDLHETKLIEIQTSSQNIQNKIKEDLRSFEGDIENKILSKNNEISKIRQKLALVETKLSQLEIGGTASEKTLSETKRYKQKLEKTSAKITELKNQIAGLRHNLLASEERRLASDKKIADLKRQAIQEENKLAELNTKIAQIQSADQMLTPETIRMLESKVDQKKLRALSTNLKKRFLKTISSMKFSPLKKSAEDFTKKPVGTNVIIYKKLLRYGDAYFLTNLKDLTENDALEFSTLTPTLDEIFALKAQ